MSVTKPISAIQRAYVKDVSFETPNGLQVLGNEWKPNLHLDLNTQVNRVGDAAFEVVLTVTVTVKNTDNVAYLCEVQQAGLFSIAMEDEGALKRALGTECPATLFPYAREFVSSLVSRGGFPQLVLVPVDFEALYDKAIAEQENSDGTKH